MIRRGERGRQKGNAESFTLGHDSGMNRRGWICEICGMTGLKDQLCAGEALMTSRCLGSLWRYSFNELEEGQDCGWKLMSSVLHLLQ